MRNTTGAVLLVPRKSYRSQHLGIVPGDNGVATEVLQARIHFPREMLNCSDSQLLNNSNAQLFNHSITQLLNCSNAQLPRCSIARLLQGVVLGERE